MEKLSLVFGLVLCLFGTTLAQRTITGKITDQDGDPLIGASILAIGTSSGTVTDIEGDYSLTLPEGTDRISVSYTGFETQEIQIGTSDVYDIAMTEGITLQEAVVTALGIAREQKSVGYAVQQVDGATIENAKEPNLINSLQGRVAGVQIQGSPSTIGGSSRITIRGVNSFLGNNQPLFVVDGIPLDNSNFASNGQQRGFGGGTAYDYGNTIQDIDPSTIESMSVLKGAAASALYGQRGANGVILITTKSGAGRKGIGVEVNSAVAFDQVANLIPHQQVYGGGATASTPTGFNEVNINGQTFLHPQYSKDGSWGPKYEGQEVLHWDAWDENNPDTYLKTRPWQAPNKGYEEFFELGQTYTNSIAITGGGEKGSVRLGYTNLTQKGTFPNARLDRNTFSINSDYQVHDRVKMTISGSYVRSDANNRNVTGYNNGNPMQAFTQWWQTQLDVDRLRDGRYRTDGTQQTWNPIGPQKDADNNLLFFETAPNFFDNPYWVRENYLQEDVRNRFYGNAGVTVDIVDGLSIFGRAGTDFYQFSLREGIPIESVETAYYGETERRFQETNLEARLRYNKDFGKFSLDAFVGGNRMRQVQRRTSISSNGGLSLPGFFNIDNSAANPTNSTFEFNWGINSVFGSASLGWGGWIYLDVTARNDWSSTLPEGNNSYFYPSTSLAIVLSELPFISNQNVLSFLKLRGSYAEVGNDASPYSLTDVFSPQTPNFGGNPRYAVPNARNNPELRPERTSEFEFGLDFQLFNGRIGGDIAYYDRTTKDQIFPVSVSAATGYTSSVFNAGEMRNYGVEMSFNVVPVRTANLRWDIFVNAFRQFNEVVSLAEGIENLSRGGTWAAELRIQEGLPYMAIFGQDYVYNENGERLVDEDGNYQFTSERVFLGSAIADWTGGFGTNVTWRGLSASVLFDFQVGGAIHSTSLQWSKYSGMHPETVSFNGESDTRANGMVLPGVKPDGTPNDIRIDPQTYYQTYWNRAAPNLFDASFLKLREIRIGYTLPNRIFGGTPFRDMNISLFGRNLAILASDLPYLDPQIITGAGNDQGLENAQVPSTRTWGINFSFKL